MNNQENEAIRLFQDTMENICRDAGFASHADFLEKDDESIAEGEHVKDFSVVYLRFMVNYPADKLAALVEAGTPVPELDDEDWTVKAMSYMTTAYPEISPDEILEHIYLMEEDLGSESHQIYLQIVWYRETNQVLERMGIAREVYYGQIQRRYQYGRPTKPTEADKETVEYVRAEVMAHMKPDDLEYFKVYFPYVWQMNNQAWEKDNNQQEAVSNELD